MIREAKQEDLMEILNLYLYLHEETVPKQSEYLSATWEQIISDKNHHFIVNHDFTTFINASTVAELTVLKLS